MVVCNGFLSEGDAGWGEWRTIVAKRYPDSPLLHDRLRTRLLDERGVAGLEAGYAERLALSSSAEEAVTRFNARAAVVDGKSVDWNQRNGTLNTQIQTADDDRQVWVSECGNRRYRETDEDAIKRGQ